MLGKASQFNYSLEDPNTHKIIHDPYRALPLRRSRCLAQLELGFRTSSFFHLQIMLTTPLAREFGYRVLLYLLISKKDDPT